MPRLWQPRVWRRSLLWSPADDSFAEHVRKPPPTTCVDQRVPLGELEATCNTRKVE